MKLILFLLFALITSFSYWLRHINLQHLKKHGTKVPQGFESVIDEEKLRKSSAYTFDSSRVGLWDSMFDNLLLVLFLFAGYIAIYDGFISTLHNSPIVTAVLFFLIMSWIEAWIGIPFDLYSTFVVEERYGFNKTTPLLWISDFLKSQAIGTVIGGALLAVVFSLIAWSPLNWWIWVWGFMAFFTFFMMFVSPYIIEPLFNKYEPVTDEELREKITALMEKAGLRVGSVQQMDASRRSNHSNAYFTGIGKVKRIVLFDTLLKQMNHDEILAVLAHEVGHWKKGHIWKRLLWGEIMALAGSWLAFQILGWHGLPGLLGLPEDLSLPARMVVLGFISSLVLFPIGPYSAWRSRCHEREADRYAAELTGRPENLASALIKMSAENLSNLFPHPLYAALNYSHPPTVERVRTLMKIT